MLWYCCPDRFSVSSLGVSYCWEPAYANAHEVSVLVGLVQPWGWWWLGWWVGWLANSLDSCFPSLKWIDDPGWLYLTLVAKTSNIWNNFMVAVGSWPITCSWSQVLTIWMKELLFTVKRLFLLLSISCGFCWYLCHDLPHFTRWYGYALRSWCHAGTSHHLQL